MKAIWTSPEKCIDLTHGAVESLSDYEFLLDEQLRTAVRLFYEALTSTPAGAAAGMSAISTLQNCTSF